MSALVLDIEHPVRGDLGLWLVEEGNFGLLFAEQKGQAALFTSEEGEDGSELHL